MATDDDPKLEEVKAVLRRLQRLGQDDDVAASGSRDRAAGAPPASASPAISPRGPAKAPVLESEPGQGLSYLRPRGASGEPGRIGPDFPGVVPRSAAKPAMPVALSSQAVLIAGALTGAMIVGWVAWVLSSGPAGEVPGGVLTNASKEVVTPTADPIATAARPAAASPTAPAPVAPAPTVSSPPVPAPTVPARTAPPPPSPAQKGVTIETRSSPETREQTTSGAAGRIAQSIQTANGLIEEGRIREARTLLLPLQDEAPDIALLMGRTYDPGVLASVPGPDARPDVEQAAHWYRIWDERARAAGIVRDSRALDRLLKSLERAPASRP